MTEQPSAEQAAEAPTFSTPEVESRTGVTYRKIDYWRRSGWVSPLNPEDEGSGMRFRWSLSEAEVIERAGSLVDMGVEPAIAVMLARRAQDARIVMRLLGQDAQPGLRLRAACPDGAACERACGMSCHRVTLGEPPTLGRYGGNVWPAWLVMRETALESSEQAAALHGTVGD